MAGRDGRSDLPTTRERIKAIAKDLYVLRGYGGFSFGDIAGEIGITRANIHHHFGGKNDLMREIVEDFVEDAMRRIAQHWAGGRPSMSRSLRLQIEDLRRFYSRYNRQPGERHVWSPLSRLRLDLPVLGALASEALERTDRFYDATLTNAVRAAIAAGDLLADTPVADVARVLRVTILNCAPMTQDTGSFEELEKLFAALERTILAAWGRKAGGR